MLNQRQHITNAISQEEEDYYLNFNLVTQQIFEREPRLKVLQNSGTKMQISFMLLTLMEFGFTIISAVYGTQTLAKNLNTNAISLEIIGQVLVLAMAVIVYLLVQSMYIINISLVKSFRKMRIKPARVCTALNISLSIWVLGSFAMTEYKLCHCISTQCFTKQGQPV